MKNNDGLMIVLLLIAFAIQRPATAEKHRSHPPEQLRFSAEDAGVKKPIPIPKDVLEILSRDELVRNVLQNQNIPVEKLPSSWFSASEIHLSGPSEKDLIVEASGPLAGGNVVTFWVFFMTPQGPRLVMMAHEHDLIVKSAYRKGHREIELDSMTAGQISTVLCRFSGKQYVAYQEKTEPIK